MGPTGEAFRILQLHPTLRCNLRCAHCYSSSGPENRGAVAAELLLGAIDDAVGERYNVLSVSGGEPLLYADLGTVLDHAHARGMVTMVVTNGTLLDRRRSAVLAGRADLVAVSIDGTPSAHNRIRCSERAFDSMVTGLEELRRVGLPFALVFTLTQRNVSELEWVSRFAVEQGARLLHVHPLEEVGRAEEAMRGCEPDDVECAFAWLEIQRLRAVHGSALALHADFLDRDLIRARPECVLAAAPCADWEEAPLADLISPLVIEADGTVTPLQYGFDRRYSLGTLAENSLHDLAATWRATRYLDFLSLCRRTYRQLDSSDLPFVNWYRALARAATSDEVPDHLPAAIAMP